MVYLRGAQRRSNLLNYLLFFDTSFSFSWHLLWPHPPSPSPVGEGAVLQLFNQLIVLPHVLYFFIQHY
jgi:hypothetical protein